MGRFVAGLEPCRCLSKVSQHEGIGGRRMGQAGLEFANRRASFARWRVSLRPIVFVKRRRTEKRAKRRVVRVVRACRPYGGAGGRFWGICAGKVKLDCLTIFSIGDENQGF